MHTVSLTGLILEIPFSHIGVWNTVCINDELQSSSFYSHNRHERDKVSKVSGAWYKTYITGPIAIAFQLKLCSGGGRVRLIL